MAPAARKSTGRAAGSEDDQRPAETLPPDASVTTQPDAAAQTERASMGRTEAVRAADTKEERAVARGGCVVKDGTPHMGSALPGKKICSAHEMHYMPDGTPRAKVHAEAQRLAEQPGGGRLADEE